MKNNLQNQLFIIIRRYELIIGSAVIIIFIVLLSNFLLKSNFIQAGRINSEKKVLKDKLAILKEKDNKLSSFDSALYQSAFSKMNQVLPEEKDYVSLFSTFDNLEKETGVIVLSAEFQFGVVSTSSARLTKAGQGIEAYAVPLGVLVEGSTLSIEKFITSLNNFASRLIDVEDVRWTKTAASGSQVLLTGRAFFYPLPPLIGKVDSPLPKVENTQGEILKRIVQVTPVQIYVSSGTEGVQKVEVGKKNLFQ